MSTKKILVLVLTLVMAVSVFAGCGSSAAPAQEPAPAAEPAAADASAEAAEGGAPEGYPSGNTVTIICSSSAGSATDVALRAFVDCFKIDGANIVVENISGGAQTVGTTEAISRPADGMNMVLMAPSGMFGQPAMNLEDNSLAYTIDDLRILPAIAPDCVAVVVVKPDSELADPDKFMDFIQNNEFTYGVPNVGGYGHIGMSYALMQLDCVDNATAVPYDDSQNVLQGVLNGELDFAVLDDNFVAAQVASGALACPVSLYDTSSPLVESKGIGEYGITGLSGVVGIKWLAVRADTPDDICEYIRECAMEAVQSDEYSNYLSTANQGSFDGVYYTEEQLDQIKHDTVLVYNKVLVALGLA